MVATSVSMESNKGEGQRRGKEKKAKFEADCEETFAIKELIEPASCLNQIIMPFSAVTSRSLPYELGSFGIFVILGGSDGTSVRITASFIFAINGSHKVNLFFFPISLPGEQTLERTGEIDPRLRISFFRLGAPSGVDRLLSSLTFGEKVCATLA